MCAAAAMRTCCESCILSILSCFDSYKLTGLSRFESSSGVIVGSRGGDRFERTRQTKVQVAAAIEWHEHRQGKPATTGIAEAGERETGRVRTHAGAHAACPIGACHRKRKK